MFRHLDPRQGYVADHVHNYDNPESGKEVIMFKKILLPIDLAHVEEGSKLIETGRELADRNGADIVMVNVIHDIPDYIEAELPQGLRGKMKDRAKSELRLSLRRTSCPARPR